MKNIYLLPTPRSVEWSAGKFRVGNSTAIALQHTAQPQVVQLALDLQAFIHSATGLRLPIVKSWNAESETDVIELDFAPSPRGESIEAYSVTISPKRVQLRGSALGLIWAERTLRQMIGQCGSGRETTKDAKNTKSGGKGFSLPCCNIEDAPKMRFRGVMLDISRGKVPTLESLFALVEQMSFFKLNVLQLYTEHTFAFRHLPLIGRGHGALTSEDIVRLDAHCRRNGVELMPCLQSFGHMYHILKLKAYEHLAEVKADKTLSATRGLTISPAKEESYKLLEQMFDDFLPSFSSGFCNVNCDETYDLGKGASKLEAQRVGIGRVYLNHILRLHKIITGKHGKRMMMWGDIILNHPELIAELPKDIIVLNWGYEAREKFETTKQFAACGLTHWVCPGTSSWNTVAPRVNNACANISRFVAAGIQTGAAGMLNTDWGDGGHYNLQGLSWHGYAFGAQCAWSGTCEAESEVAVENRSDKDRPGQMAIKNRCSAKFDAAFGRTFFGNGGEKIAKAFRALGSACDNEAMNLRNGSRTMRLLFGDWKTLNQDERLKPLSVQALRNALATARQTGNVFAAALRQKGRSAEQRLTLREYQFSADLLAFAAKKMIFLKRHPKASRFSGALKRQRNNLMARFKALWLARAKPQGMAISWKRFQKAL